MTLFYKMSKKNKQDSLKNVGLKWYLDSQILNVSQAHFFLLTSNSQTPGDRCDEKENICRRVTSITRNQIFTEDSYMTYIQRNHVNFSTLQIHSFKMTQTTSIPDDCYSSLTQMPKNMQNSKEKGKEHIRIRERKQLSNWKHRIVSPNLNKPIAS